MSEATIKISVSGSEIATDAFRSIATEAERVSPAVGKMNDSFKAGAGPTQGLTDQLRGFDGMLGALGIHIAPEIRAIGELGAAAGGSALGLGLVTTAGIALATFVASFKLTRLIVELTDLDTEIANSTARLMGWGDLGAQQAGAKADTLAEASRRAGMEIKDLDIAVAINSERLKFHADNATISAAAVAGWHTEIARVKTAGELDSLTKDLASQNFEVKDLAERYHVSVAALQVFTRETKAAGDAEAAASDVTKAHNKTLLDALADEFAATKKMSEAMAELNSAGQGWQGTLDTIDGTTVEAIKYYLAAGVSQSALAEAYGLTATQVKSVASELDAEKTGLDAAAGAAHRDAEEHRRLGDAQTAMAAAAVKAFTDMNSAVMGLDTTYAGWNKEVMDGHSMMDALNMDLESTAKNVRTLAGEYLTAAEAKKRFDMGGSFQFDETTTKGLDAMTPWLHEGFSMAQAERLAALASVSFDQARAYAAALGALKGPRVPGFAEGVQDAPGGWAMVGERGPEPMYVPPHASIFPSGSRVGGDTIINVAFNGNVVADRQQFETMVKDVFVKVARQTRLLPS